MGIFNNNKEERSYNPGISGDELFSAFPSGSIPLSAIGTDTQRALKSSDLFAACTIIAKDVARMDIKVEVNGIIDERNRLNNLINVRPNGYTNGYMFKMGVMMSALLSMHGYILIERAPTGVPIELHHIQTSRIQLKEERKTGKFYYELNNGKHERIEVPFTDIIDIKPNSLDGINGISMLSALENDLNADIFSKQFVANYYRNGTQAGSVLKMKDGKLSPEAREKLKLEFQAANSGEGLANSTMILDSTMEFQKLDVNTDILKLISSNTVTASAIAKVFGLPLSKLGIETTNVSLTDSMDSYLHDTLGTYFAMWTSELAYKLIDSKDDNNKSFVFDTSAYRKINWSVFIEDLLKELAVGAINLDEYRKATGREPLPNGLGSKHRVDLNHIDLELADDFQLRDTGSNGNNQATKAVSDEASQGGEIENE